MQIDPAPPARPGVFLRATWRCLAMINYTIDPAALAPLAPAGTEVDSFEGQTYVSMVGFHFCDTRVFGVPIPFHCNFEEVNLRFYVRRRTPEGWRRGVVFVSEIVPRLAIATIARLAYNEAYRAMPMSHTINLPGEPGGTICAEYGWKHRGRWDSLLVKSGGEPALAREGSLEEFITEHYWGYTSQRDGGCLEYEVEHPRWRLWRARSCSFKCDVAAMYGPAFAKVLHGEPASAFLAEGSAVSVRRGRRLAEVGMALRASP